MLCSEQVSFARADVSAVSQRSTMAGEGCIARLVRTLSDLCLLMRAPARRFAGSVHTAATVCAILVAVYNIIIGAIYYSGTYYFYYSLQVFITIAGSLAFLASFVDVVLIFGVLRRKEEYLHSIVCAALAIYMICVLVPFCLLIGLAINGKWIVMLWELPRVLLYPVHVSVLYCLLLEVRGAPSAPLSPAEWARDGRRDGWLSGNMAHAGPGQALDGGALLKAQNSGPTLAPTHFAPPTAAPHSGPLSSSEA